MKKQIVRHSKLLLLILLSMCLINCNQSQIPNTQSTRISNSVSIPTKSIETTINDLNNEFSTFTYYILEYVQVTTEFATIMDEFTANQENYKNPLIKNEVKNNVSKQKSLTKYLIVSLDPLLAWPGLEKDFKDIQGLIMKIDIETSGLEKNINCALDDDNYSCFLEAMQNATLIQSYYLKVVPLIQYVEKKIRR